VRHIADQFPVHTNRSLRSHSRIALTSPQIDGRGIFLRRAIRPVPERHDHRRHIGHMLAFDEVSLDFLTIYLVNYSLFFTRVFVFSRFFDEWKLKKLEIEMNLEWKRK